MAGSRCVTPQVVARLALSGRTTLYDIHMAEISEEFVECWSAAGKHLEIQAQGPIQSWIRAHLTPPFLEHLSFRLGNQLFFIRIEDAKGTLKVPGTLEGLFSVADGCDGHACLMSMKKSAEGWKPASRGWGLLDARTGKEISPPQLISNEPVVMTDWELHDLAVQIVRQGIEKDGYKLMSWQSNPHVDPSIWFVGSEGPEWVVVRAARYPTKSASLPSNIEAIANRCGEVSSIGSFAEVALVNADDPFDPLAESNGNYFPILRGHRVFVGYHGLTKIETNR
jgi:hypothetical protein